MGLSGTFATMPFPDVLQWLGESRQSGSLTVVLEFDERYLRFRDGHIDALASKDPRSHDMVRLLLGRTLLDEARVHAVIAEQARTARPLRSVLIDDGHIARAELDAALRGHVKDMILEIFLYDDGRFLFSTPKEGSLMMEADATWDLAVDPPISAREVLMDGVRRIDEWRRMNEVFPSDYTIVHAIGRAPGSPVVDALVAAGEPLTLGDLCMRVARPRFEVIEQLYDAWRRQLVAVEATPQELAAAKKTSPIAMLVQAATTLLDAQQFDEAAALLRSAGDLDPMNEEVRGLLHRAHAEQLEQLYREFPPYRVPVVVASRDRVGELQLSPRERYLLFRIDGRWDVGTLTVITPVGEIETLRILKKLQHIGLITMR
jgi:hypothetical protein